jgi:hypothetical protein
VSQISRHARFRASDPPALILEDLACPVCGFRDPGEPHLRITDNTIRIFCDGCGAFITILLDDEQGRAIKRCGAVREYST